MNGMVKWKSAIICLNSGQNVSDLRTFNIHFRFFERMERVVTWVLYPIMPTFGISFSLAYLGIGVFIYNYPNIENLVVWRWNKTWYQHTKFWPFLDLFGVNSDFSAKPRLSHNLWKMAILRQSKQFRARSYCLHWTTFYVMSNAGLIDW